MYRYEEELTKNGTIVLFFAITKTIEIGNGPILMSLHNFPEVQNKANGYIRITDGDGTSLLEWTELYSYNRRGYYENWSELNGRTYSSQTNRVTVEFYPGHSYRYRERDFLNSSLQWTSLLMGYDTDLACSDGCVETAAGPKCYCPQGYTLDHQLTSCRDSDECSLLGSCSQNCHNTPGSFSCSCRPGYVMQNNSCIAISEPLLIFSTVTEIRALGLRTSKYFPVVSQLPHVVGVGYDHLLSRVYWTDVQAGRESIVSTVLTSNFSTAGSKVEVSTSWDQLVTSGLDMPEQLAVDAANMNLYFTDSYQQQVGVCSLQGGGCAVLVSGVERPRGVAIHQASAQLLLTDWGQTPRILIMALDGSNKRDLVTENIVWPNGLAVDQITDRVYWADSKQDVIESVDLDGGDRRTILTSHPKHPFSLAVFEDSLYWSDWETQEIVSCNKASYGKLFLFYFYLIRLF